MANIALFIFGINDLSGGGGAERFFADFFDVYSNSETKHKLYYIIDKNSVSNLNKVNKLTYIRNLLDFRIVSNRFKDVIEFIQIIRFILFKRIKLIHIPLYSISYVPLMRKINSLPSWIRPKLTINIVNCYVPQALNDAKHPQHTGFTKTYSPLFEELFPDGYFSWNQNFIDYLKAENLSRNNQILYAIKSRFSDTKKFYPEVKSNTIVFASRLDQQKHPDWFIKALVLLKKKDKSKLEKWKFVVCGKGPLLDELQNEVEKNNLKSLVDFKEEGELWKILNYSKAYVSCQDYDNFPSLAMAEAMASGNAIIARNVGQTELFVKDLKNGILLKDDSPQGLADAIEYYISNPGIHQDLEKESLRLIREVHTPQNFIRQIDEFWDEVLMSK